MIAVRRRAGATTRGSSLVELLVASGVGLMVVLGAVQILHAHAVLALQVQADLAASTTAAWALRTALRDVRTAGADPLGMGLSALAHADRASLTLSSDRNGDGLADARSRETVALFWTAARGGGLSRRIGSQSMILAAGVPGDAWRLRYYDREGQEVGLESSLDEAARGRIRRVWMSIVVEEALGSRTGRAALMGAASLRLREGLP